MRCSPAQHLPRPAGSPLTIRRPSLSLRQVLYISLICGAGNQGGEREGGADERTARGANAPHRALRAPIAAATAVPSRGRVPLSPQSSATLTSLRLYSRASGPGLGARQHKREENDIFQAAGRPGRGPLDHEEVLIAQGPL